MKSAMLTWIKKNWGYRCKRFELDCASCKAYMCFDYLFQYAQKPELTVDFEISRLSHSNWKEDTEVKNHIKLIKGKKKK